jgi:hypothetical protein
MQVDIDTLMTWARGHAPVDGIHWDADIQVRRRVRLEIAAERAVNTHTRRGYTEHVVARAYLAEPRCKGVTHMLIVLGLVCWGVLLGKLHGKADKPKK